MICSYLLEWMMQSNRKVSPSYLSDWETLVTKTRVSIDDLQLPNQKDVEHLRCLRRHWKPNTGNLYNRTHAVIGKSMAPGFVAKTQFLVKARELFFLENHCIHMKTKQQLKYCKDIHTEILDQVQCDKYQQSLKDINIFGTLFNLSWVIKGR